MNNKKCFVVYVHIYTTFASNKFKNEFNDPVSSPSSYLRKGGLVIVCTVLNDIQ